MSAIERVRPSDPRVPVPPQLALRVAILGGIAVVLFSVIFFRLWYLQILTGEQYVHQADVNRVRDLPIPAPRGEILDRSGGAIVTSRTTNAVQITPSALPAARVARAHLYDRLGRLLQMSPHRIGALVEQGRNAVRYAPVTIKTDAGPGVETVLAEQASAFPGVSQQPISIRSYPYGDMAAQVLGHVDQISEQELKLKSFRGVLPGTVVGQEGLEFYYDRYLRGRAGVQRVAVNASGNPVPTQARADAAAGRAQPQADARPRPAAGERKGAARGDRTRARRRQTRGRGGVRRDRPAQRAGARDRLLPELRPEQVRQTAHEGRIRGARGRRLGGRPADQPRRRRHVSDGLDVQADHRHGRARRGRDHALGRARRGPVHLRRRPSSSATPGTPNTAPSRSCRR